MSIKAMFFGIASGLAMIAAGSTAVSAQERLPWEKPALSSQPSRLGGANDAYQPSGGYPSQSAQGDVYAPQPTAPGGAYGQQPPGQVYRSGDPYQSQPYQSQPYQSQPYQSQPYQGQPTQSQPYQSQGTQVYPGARVDDAYRPPSRAGYSGATPPYGAPYPATDDNNGLYDQAPGRPYQPPRYDAPPPPRYDGQPPYRAEEAPDHRYYSQNEIIEAGHGFFGSVSRGLASAVEWAFQNAGRPNGYILGEDAGGAFVAGLRYGEGVLHTKNAGHHKVYWQGPSLGYDIGAEGSKTMVLVYNLRDISEIYNRFGGVQGAAYLVGGVSVQLQKYGDVVLAPIRSGIGVRLGANVGYLKYTRSPTWNPF